MRTSSTFILAILALAAPTAFADEVVEVGGLNFTVPEEWTEQQPSSSMRAAELRFDAEGDEDPVAAFFHMGGSVEANISRWAGQFVGQPDVDMEELEGGGAIVIISGTYLDGPPMVSAAQKTPKEGYRMLGAIIPTSPAQAVFIKLTAPDAIADAALESFRAMVQSALSE